MDKLKELNEFVVSDYSLVLFFDLQDISPSSHLLKERNDNIVT